MALAVTEQLINMCNSLWLYSLCFYFNLFNMICMSWKKKKLPANLKRVFNSETITSSQRAITCAAAAAAAVVVLPWHSDLTTWLQVAQVTLSAPARPFTHSTLSSTKARMVLPLIPIIYTCALHEQRKGEKKKKENPTQVF